MNTNQADGVHKCNMKTATSVYLSLVLSLLSLSSAWAQVSIRVNSHTNQRYTTIRLSPINRVPEKMAALVATNDPLEEWQKEQDEAREEWLNEYKTNHNVRFVPTPPPHGRDFSQATWVPFKTNLTVDLGIVAGKKTIWLGFQYHGELEPNGSWEGIKVTLQTTPSTIAITGPKQRITSQPVIQLQGTISSDLGSPLRYQLLDQNGVVTANGEGLVNDRYFDQTVLDFTTNYFTCYDLQLSPGMNTIVLRGTDSAGFSFATNFVCVFTTVGDTNPPGFSIDWPQAGTEIVGDTFTVRGQSDDPTAKMVGKITAKGHTNFVNGEVERDGYFWFEDLPLSLGANYLTLTATDLAGNTSSTNMIFYGVEGPVITMDPISPASQLWQSMIRAVTGKVNPANSEVWINGVQATVKPDGTWVAEHVPVRPPNRGIACFDMTSVPPEGVTNGTVKVGELIAAQADLGTNAVVLNASSPACGIFQLHLANTAGRNFVLQASTNLVEWTPILTNLNPNDVFDFTDANAKNYPCRFFRVVPLL